jgi:hypothetical protein
MSDCASVDFDPDADPSDALLLRVDSVGGDPLSLAASVDAFFGHRASKALALDSHPPIFAPTPADPRLAGQEAGQGPPHPSSPPSSPPSPPRAFAPRAALRGSGGGDRGRTASIGSAAPLDLGTAAPATRSAPAHAPLSAQAGGFAPCASGQFLDFPPSLGCAAGDRVGEERPRPGLGADPDLGLPLLPRVAPRARTTDRNDRSRGKVS